MKQLLPLLLLCCIPYALGKNNLELAKKAEQLPRLVMYDSSYRQIDYPNGDIPSHYGVCSDVVIRSYRQLGIDLQKRLHEDIKKNFSQYPSQKIWGLSKPDANIDHRRVPNLETFFTRKGTVKPITLKGEDYRPGDIVSWRLDNGRPHIGIVTSIKASNSQSYLVMHNIGYGQVAEDVLFKWKIVGHYSY
ncbi:DUF1287 domain-containing protein [Providencia alcalifaciens]|uniref:DUF1287 domain-containing protein n=2 Tax=Providencia alcalifaciens TaxID=126385 RepID=A0AAW9V773_9GAMM|nr:DUF1287 domain-containing protein [Providencia alcalifaciens]ETT07269.1 PF06940 domain protein [Providencia alcalifaciens F90-2004]EUC96356.1 PF06940 domain protein [Providencia alcalifaciens PAL-2]ATG16395.1 DUF1287 domain-containing protein [Providencia alcalifaciens]EEB45642.1 hypothetical protein PROVALCAL_02457 [Providencia alcalifaciens DSM 30120]MTB31392.1 DUF1287 domain-containing protein [Providencia alcalifaciens]